ncbi:MAG: phenylacetate--CoA ligase family protein [bacterium]|nr:phenylacetate--CoA ligase family protein [bacterium]
MPIPLQNAACSLAGWHTVRQRFGETFRGQLAAYEERNRWSHNRIVGFRNARLKDFVRHCADTVPYYRALFPEYGIDPGSIREIEDLKQLPVLTKEEIRRQPHAFYSDDPGGELLMNRDTGGTTGNPLRFGAPPGTISEQWAVWWRYWRWHGIQADTWCGYFVGLDVVPRRQKRAPFWRTNLPRRQIMFSAYHMNDRSLPEYIKELRRRRPPWLHGYPSVLALVANHLLAVGDDIGYMPRWISTGAENLLPTQRDIIERAFGVTPIQHYGLAEGVANISQCEHSRLHVDEDFAAVEIADADDDGHGHLVGSNLSNPAFCLLRYDTQDIVSGLTEESCPCGHPGRLVSAIDGRREDYVILPDGTKLGRLAHVFVGLDFLREAQIVQNKPGRIIVRIVPRGAFGRRETESVEAALRRRVGEEMGIDVTVCDALERSSSGKLRFVVSGLRSGELQPIPRQGIHIDLDQKEQK